MNPMQTSKSKFCCYFHPLIDFITSLLINPFAQRRQMNVHLKNNLTHWHIAEPKALEAPFFSVFASHFHISHPILRNLQNVIKFYIQIDLF